MESIASEIRTRYEKTVGRWPTALDILIAHDLDLAVHFVNLAAAGQGERSEEHTSELQSLMRISYAVFCLKKKNKKKERTTKLQMHDIRNNRQEGTRNSNH